MVVKKAKRDFIICVVCSVLHFICSGIDIYLAISSGKYLYFLPAVFFAISCMMNVINALKYQKKIKG